MATRRDDGSTGPGDGAGEHFIPYRRVDVVAACAEELDPADRADFLGLAKILTSLLHVQFHDRLERLKDCFIPFNPDAEARRLVTPDAEAESAAHTALVAELRGLLTAANYVEVPPAALRAAFQEASLLRVDLHVELDDFVEVLFFTRGRTDPEVELPRPRLLRRWWSPRRLSVPTYRRVVMYLRYRDADHFAAQGRTDLPFRPGSTSVKLFQDVPAADLEMLLPNAEVRMRWADRLLIGVPAVASGVVVVATKLLASLGLLVLLVGAWLGLRTQAPHLDQAALATLLGGVLAVGGYLARQWSKFTSRKIAFMKTLSDNLYFRNLANGLGVFYNLLDAAEEEECKEALLASCFLATTGPASDAELDARVEAWFAERLGCPLDFDVTDAVGKLERLGLAHREEGRWVGLPPGEALLVLDRTWDAYYDVAGTGTA